MPSNSTDMQGSTTADGVGQRAQQIDNSHFTALDVHVAAMEYLIDESESLGVSLELPRAVKALADRAVAAGLGQDSYAAMVPQFRDSAHSTTPGDPE